MFRERIRLATPARLLKNAATVLVLSALFALHGVSRAAAAASNGHLNWSYIDDDLCLAGPYKNSDAADILVSFSATTGGPGELVWVGIWNSVINDISMLATTPAGSTTAAGTDTATAHSNYLIGNDAYLYLRASFTDAGDGRTNGTAPLSPTDVPAGGGANYHQTAIDMSQDPDCTSNSLPSKDKTVDLVEGFLTSRASLVLSNQPDIQRRIDRLNGAVSSGSNPVSSLMGYLPGIVEGSPLDVSISLGAIDRLAGNEAPGGFDIWLEGTFALIDDDGSNGNFRAGSFGADYLITPDLLIGGFVQMDHLSQSSTPDASTISGTGWLAGPYVTAPVGEHLYVDIVAAVGASQNKISPHGTYEDSLGTTRWLLSASLQGQWQWDSWTFSPRARVSYFEEISNAYIDGLGVGIPAITVGLGRVAMGPSISYRYTTEGNVIIDTGLRLEGVAEILNTSAASGLDNLHGRIEGTIDLSLPAGTKLGLSTALAGIGGNTGNTTSAKIRVSLPIN